jgi:hypothetical protein
MDDEQARRDVRRRTPAMPTEPSSEFSHPRSVDILTTEHWGLLSTRTLGYQEMFGRTTIFIAILSATFVALALLAQATRFGRETLALAVVLFSVSLFIGVTTFVRCVAINYEDARWLEGIRQLRRAYLQIAPELKPYLTREPSAGERALAHGSPQRLRNVAISLTTTSSVVAALDSALVGSLVGVVGALTGIGLAIDVTVGAVASVVSAGLHVRYAAQYRRSHSPSDSDHE